jgi:hypothetical protein
LKCLVPVFDCSRPSAECTLSKLTDSAGRSAAACGTDGATGIFDRDRDRDGRQRYPTATAVEVKPLPCSSAADGGADRSNLKSQFVTSSCNRGRSSICLISVAAGRRQQYAEGAGSGCGNLHGEGTLRWVDPPRHASPPPHRVGESGKGYDSSCCAPRLIRPPLHYNMGVGGRLDSIG